MGVPFSVLHCFITVVHAAPVFLLSGVAALSMSVCGGKSPPTAEGWSPRSAASGDC